MAKTLPSTVALIAILVLLVLARQPVEKLFPKANASRAVITSTGKGFNDYRPADSYWIVADNWSINDNRLRAKEPQYQLVAKHAGKEFRWHVDLQFLCHRINSNVLCTGYWQQYITNYLNRLKKSKNVLVVELPKGEPPFVLGLWEFNPTGLYKNACLGGSSSLGMTPEQAKALGQVAFIARLHQLSHESWKALLAK